MKEVDALARVYGKAFLLVPSDSVSSAALGGIKAKGAAGPKYCPPNKKLEVGSGKLWVLACFQSSNSDTIAYHEQVSKLPYDSEVLTRFRELYFRERRWIQRFFELKEVKKISVINVSFRLGSESPFSNAHGANSLIYCCLTESIISGGIIGL